MEKFFRDFWKENKTEIISFTLLRIFSFIQVLFWPYAFSRVINILSNSPAQWQIAVLWAGAMMGNKVAEDFVRIKAKYELEKMGSKLQISLATFFSEQTELKDGKKTGESVQAIKKASEDVDELLDFYRDNLLRMPVNLIIIPIVLLQANLIYLVLLVIYAGCYLFINHVLHKIYQKRLKKYFEAAETFWGTTYRKTPEVWREREDGYAFANEIHEEGNELYEKEVSANKINMIRWVAIQAFSSAFIGGMVLFVIDRIINGIAPVGTLILVTAYFQETQLTLNIITTTINQITNLRLSLKRLSEAVKIRET